MRIKCLRCGKEFDGKSVDIHCPECLPIIKHTFYRARVCKDCGEEFSGGPRAWYCPECRKIRRKKQKLEYEARKKAGNVRALGSMDICAICGKEYIVESGLQKYCPECGEIEKIRIKLENSRKHARKNMPKRKENREKARAAISCVICGKIFIPRGNFTTCSPECSKQLARKLNAEWRKSHK